MRGPPDPVKILSRFAGGRRIAETDCVAAVIAFYRAAGLVDRDLEIIDHGSAVALLRLARGDLVKAARIVIEALGWKEIAPGDARDLDCGVSHAWGQQTMSIRVGAGWIAPGPDGVVMLPGAVRAWRAPRGGGNGH